MASDVPVPIFPLQTVLVPGGHLPLRIFEPRYLDMIRDCSQDDAPFGVCLLLPESSDVNHQHHARVGTLAVIRDFYTLDDGLLGITARGDRRFRMCHTSIRDNGLMMATVEELPEPERAAVPTSCSLLAHITHRLMDKVGDNYPEFQPDCLEDAAWVGYRLTELLPLENLEKQVLLELNDPLQRLQRLLEVMPRFQAGQEDE